MIPFKTALIDGDFIPFYVCYNKKDTPKKTLEETLSACDNLIYNILINTRVTHYIGFLGNKGKKTFRHEINPEYKSKRKKDLPPYFRECQAHLLSKWKFVLTPEELEVDDCLNISRFSLPNSFIVSPDRDLLQLEGKHYNPKKHEWVDNTFQHEAAEFVFWKDMLAGQSGDSIAGIRGIGEDTAPKILNCLDLSECKTILDIQTEYACYVLKLYILKKGVSLGINDFYKTYNSLKILESHESFILPELVQFNLDEFIESQIEND